MESRDVKLLELIFEGTIKPRDVKLSALESITANFSEERIIGKGGFATVYKGILRNGEVAVKRIKNNQTIDEKLFQREVNSLLIVSHKNIVRFLGFCSHTEQKAIDFDGSGEYILAEDRERILCLEYINNGSLEKYTADELRGLPWDTRVLVIKGICEGLQYLHMKEHIIHRDLKPANILIDINMVAKITDFGLSRMEKNAETKSTVRISSLGYTAPEYIEKGEMSAKYDVYSLGIIIIEMVTGSRNIPDSNNVLRRWRHRLRKSGKDTPFVYQQIAKLIEIGLLCQEKDPYRRPSISDIIRDINELESTDRQISNANESTAEQISPYLEDDMLGIEPLELRFPFKLNSQISSSIELTNKTNTFIAFIIQTTSPLPYFIQPKKDIVAPRSQYIVNITLQSLDKAPQDRGCTGDFIVRSTKVNESIISEDITEDTFNRDEGKLVDEVNLTIAYEAEVPQVDLYIPQESDVQPTEAESKTSSNELIKFDPPELCLPLLPNQRVLSSAKVVNITDQYIGFRICTTKSNSARYYANPLEGILPPLSTKALLITRIAEEKELEESQCKDKFLLWNGIVPEDMKARDVIDNMSDTKCTTLPIILTKTNSSLSDDLIQFDPPELHFPFLPNKKVMTSIKIVNLTDYNVGFNTYSRPANAAWYHTEPARGILPPWSTKKLMVTREEKEYVLKDKQFNDKYFVWKGIVSEGVKDSDLSDCMADQESVELPIILDKICSSISNELIQFDPAEICIPLLLNKTMLFSVDVINTTDFYVAFHAYWMKRIAPRNISSVGNGILPPRSTKKIILAWVTDENELEDIEANGSYFVWNRVVTERVKSGDIISYMDEEESKKIPLIPEKASPCTSNELIQFDPPELSLPFMPNKPLVFSVNIVNNTEYCVGFFTYNLEGNVGHYCTLTDGGVIPPRSTQRLVVIRTPKNKENEEKQCEDKFFLWTCFVGDGVKAWDIYRYTKYEESKELPLSYKKTSLLNSDELIKFDPPQLSFPFVPNKRVPMLRLFKGMFKIVNVTDHMVCFHVWSPEDRYKVEPTTGILPRQSTQAIKVRRTLRENETEDMQCKDKIFVWNGIVTDGVENGDVGNAYKRKYQYRKEEASKELPIVLTKPGESSSM